MDEPSAPSEQEAGTDAEAERVGDALRSAVERTLAATAGSASGTRQRARELLDEVSRRGEVAREELGRRGDAARQEVSRRGDAARQDLARRGEAARGEVAKAQETASRGLADRIGLLERRLSELEQALRGTPDDGDEGATTSDEEALDQAPHAGKSQRQVEVENTPREPGSGG
jgi:polyhydroxyalkanoate synthesis regulator phasin